MSPLLIRVLGRAIKKIKIIFSVLRTIVSDEGCGNLEGTFVTQFQPIVLCNI
jgi:hypothetical protein